MKIELNLANDLIQWAEKYAKNGVHLSVNISEKHEQKEKQLILGLLPYEALKNISNHKDQKPFWYFIMDIEDPYPYKEEG